jgi:hypothetical protein
MSTIVGLSCKVTAWYFLLNEYSDNQEWAIQRNWQHWAYKTKTSETKNTTQYVLDTIIRKQTQIT